MSIARTAEDYHQQTTKQAQKQPKFKISDMVAIKINKVDKINTFHPNMLLGQIIEIEESGYVRIVTQYGKVNTVITPWRFYPYIATNVKLDFSTKTSFTAACKKASGLYNVDEKLLIGAKFPLYYSLRYLDMEKQNKLLQDTNLKILFY